jgi:poly(hydroxyalkanoate) depolymerase family esterase
MSRSIRPRFQRPFRPRFRRRLGAVLVAAALVTATFVTAAATPARAATGTFFAGTYLSIFGARDYHGYLPSSYRSGTPAPLVVALHGCTENDIGFDLLSGWTVEAEQQGFVVVYPDQNNFANPAGCWNWFLPTNQHRGAGEPALIAGITNQVRTRYTIDARRVYVTGVSAGGVMANIMAVTYPDVFAASSMLAGCEYRCDVLQTTTPEQSGQWAITEMGSRRRAIPAIVFQGTADIVVAPSTADRIVGQWATVDAISTVPSFTEAGQVPGGRSYTRTGYGGGLIEQYLINGAGHVYPGGCSCSLYGDPSGPDATGLTWAFFAAHPRP